MNIRRLSLRFNLDNEQDRLAYEKLQNIDRTQYKSVNSYIISVINKANDNSFDVFRKILREELKSVAISAVTDTPENEDNDRMVLEDLEMFM